MFIRFIFTVALLVFFCLQTVATPLDDYIAAPDPNYSYSLANSISGPGYTAKVWEMTSQAWRSPSEVDRTLWKHWLIVVVPSILHHDKSLLYISAGNNGGPAPSTVDSSLLSAAFLTNSVVAEIRMIPNQPIKFSDAILSGRPIEVYGEGRMSRDFTYVDDIVEAIMRLVDVVPREESRVTTPGIIDTLSAGAPFRTVNIGGGQPVGLMTFIETIEKALGRPATRNYLPMQPGDVPRTFASTDLLAHLTGFAPSVPLEEGIAAFVAWYLEWRGC